MGALTREVNPTADSDRVQAPVVGAGFADFGGSHMHYTVNETATEDKLLEINHLASTVFTAPNEEHAKKWNKEFSSLEKQIDALFVYIAPKSNIYTRKLIRWRAASK